ncbi:MAG: threonine dehydratase [Methanomassiliicoccales archaeon PtaU1.Bin124]|nr:MAG: threonine dehydratase [Methanomassiliicoccales archaeon PtaU1.Bin124]
MRVNVDLRLKDVPGQLIGALEPVSKNDGNIVGVVHSHDQVSAGRIGVNLTFEVSNEKTLDKIFSEWREKGVDILKIDQLFETFTLEYVIVGDVSPAEMKRITDGIQALGDVESIDVRYSISSSNERAALISGKVRKKETIKLANRFMRERSKKAGFLIVRGFGD